MPDISNIIFPMLLYFIFSPLHISVKECLLLFDDRVGKFKIQN